MTNQSTSLSSTHATGHGFARQLIQRLAAAVAARRALHREKSAAKALQQMDARLLEDIGVAATQPKMPMEQLAKMNPAVLAATVFAHNR